jgi:hypothetical protein
MAGAKQQVRVILEIKGQSVRVDITTPQGLDFQAEGLVKLDENSSPRSLTWCNFVGPGEQPLPEIAAIYKVDDGCFTVRNGGLHGVRPKEFTRGDSALADLVVFRRLGSDDDRRARSIHASP